MNNEDDALRNFLIALVRLSHEHGIAIEDGATLYMMERDDFALDYECDADSRLRRKS